MVRFLTGARGVLGLAGLFLFLLGPALAALFGPGGDANLVVGGVLVGSGLVLMALATLAGRVSRGSRRHRAVARTATSPPPRSAFLDTTTPVVLVDNDLVDGWSSGRDGVYELHGGDTTVVLTHDSVWVGATQEWRLHVSARSARVESLDTSIATADRSRSRATEWTLEAPPHTYSAVVEQTQSKERSRQRTFLFYRDVTRRTLRRGTIRKSSGGEPVARIELLYEVEQRPQFGKASHQATFSGTITVFEPLPFSVAVLTLRLVLWRWARRTPRVGEWVTSAGGG